MAAAVADDTTFYIPLGEALELFTEDPRGPQSAKSRLWETLAAPEQQDHWFGTLHTLSVREGGKRDTDPGEGSAEFWRSKAGPGETVQFNYNLEESWVRRKTYEPRVSRAVARRLEKERPRRRLRSKYKFTGIYVSLNILARVSPAAAQRLVELQAREAAPPREVQPSELGSSKPASVKVGVLTEGKPRRPRWDTGSLPTATAYRLLVAGYPEYQPGHFPVTLKPAMAMRRVPELRRVERNAVGRALGKLKGRSDADVPSEG
jgi:hypothetical protein